MRKSVQVLMRSQENERLTVAYDCPHCGEKVANMILGKPPVSNGQIPERCPLCKKDVAIPVE